MTTHTVLTILASDVGHVLLKLAIIIIINFTTRGQPQRAEPVQDIYLKPEERPNK